MLLKLCVQSLLQADRQFRHYQKQLLELACRIDTTASRNNGWRLLSGRQ